MDYQAFLPDPANLRVNDAHISPEDRLAGDRQHRLHLPSVPPCGHHLLPGSIVDDQRVLKDLACLGDVSGSTSGFVASSVIPQAVPSASSVNGWFWPRPDST